jgi:hypothetical protein
MDLLVYYWGRTTIVFLRAGDAISRAPEQGRTPPLWVR